MAGPLARNPRGWLVLGLLVAQTIAAGELLMSKRIPCTRVMFHGPQTSRAGFDAAAEITAKSGARELPYLVVLIKDAHGREVYRTGEYAAWFSTRLCWDDAGRLWIDSMDTGTDVLAETASGWRRYRWMADSGTDTVLDAESGQRLDVVDWTPPEPLRSPMKE